jgi:hypothetical protein
LMHDLHWLAGILEGEGSFLCSPPSKPNCPRISCNMTDEDVIARIARLLNAKYHKVRKKKRKPQWKDSWVVNIGGLRILQMMQLLRPLMSIRRQSQIDKAITSYDPARGRRRREVTRRFSEDQLAIARERIRSGESMRSVAKNYGVHHESLRQRLIHGIPDLPDRSFLIVPSEDKTVYIQVQ